MPNVLRSYNDTTLSIQERLDKAIENIKTKDFLLKRISYMYLFLNIMLYLIWDKYEREDVNLTNYFYSTIAVYVVEILMNFLEEKLTNGQVFVYTAMSCIFNVLRIILFVYCKADKKAFNSLIFIYIFGVTTFNLLTLALIPLFIIFMMGVVCCGVCCPTFVENIFIFLIRMGWVTGTISRLQTPATKEKIDAIPLIDATEEHLEQECSICLSKYELGEKIREMRCKHLFHKDCLDTWLIVNSVCPYCKDNINEDAKHECSEQSETDEQIQRNESYQSENPMSVV